jgi:hypothetical protein
LKRWGGKREMTRLKVGDTAGYLLDIFEQITGCSTSFYTVLAPSHNKRIVA